MGDESQSEETKTRILVVEDEEAIRRGLCDVLAYHGHAPTAASDGDEGLDLATNGDFALLLLDVMLPGKSGFEVCRALREGSHTVPVLMLTARGSEEDVLEGFRSGADDYVTKPFSLAELMARVEAILRRTAGRDDAETTPFEFGPWRVDPANLRAETGDLRVDLSVRELEIVQLFFRERGRIVSRRMLLAEIWRAPDPDRLETRTVDMQIAKLRKKLDRPGKPGRNDQARGAREEPGSLLETVRGAGYRFGG